MSETLFARRTATFSVLAFMLAAQAALQLLDLATTYLALQAGAVEANPISRAVIEGPGWWAYGAIKGALAAGFLLLWPLTRALDGRERRFVTALMTFFGVAMTGVVVNNVIVLA